MINDPYLGGIWTVHVIIICDFINTKMPLSWIKHSAYSQQEHQKQEEELKAREAELMRGNPLINLNTSTSFNVKRRCILLPSVCCEMGFWPATYVYRCSSFIICDVADGMMTLSSRIRLVVKRRLPNALSMIPSETISIASFCRNTWNSFMFVRICLCTENSVSWLGSKLV